MKRIDRGHSIVLLFWILLLLLLHVGCGGADNANAAASGDGKTLEASKGGDGDEAADKADKEEAVPVEVAALDRGVIESVLRFSSNLEAEKEVKVFSQAKRLVTSLVVEEGHRVSKGQLLLRLQDGEQRSALEKVKSQLAKAEREYSQQQRLYAQQLISEQAYNDATYELDQLKIALDDANRELSYTEVRAPISGTVTSRMVNLGDQVQIGQHLFDIVDFDSLVARIFVPEKHLATLSPGLKARLSTQAVDAGEYECEVQRIAPVVDPKSGTVKVTVAVGGQRGLRPGMYVDVDLVTGANTDAVLVPKRAVIYDNDQMFVFRLADERRVERIFLEPRLSDRDHIEPIAGLDAGDQLVVAGQAGLKDGALVRLPGDEVDPEGDDETILEAQPVEKASL